MGENNQMEKLFIFFFYFYFLFIVIMPSHIGKGILATVSLLACIYHDRAVFDPKRPDIKTQPGWPLVGNLPILLQYLMQIHDFLLEGFTRLDDMTLYVPIYVHLDFKANIIVRTLSALGIPRHVGTIDPRNVEHILKSIKVYS